MVKWNILGIKEWVLMISFNIFMNLDSVDQVTIWFYLSMIMIKELTYHLSIGINKALPSQQLQPCA